MGTWKYLKFFILSLIWIRQWLNCWREIVIDRELVTSEFQSNVVADMNGMSEVYGRLTWLAVWPCEVSHWPLATVLCNVCPARGIITGHGYMPPPPAQPSSNPLGHSLRTSWPVLACHSDCWLLVAVGLGPASSIRSYNQLFPWSDFSIHHLLGSAAVKFSSELTLISSDVNADKWLTRVKTK